MSAPDSLGTPTIGERQAIAEGDLLPCPFCGGKAAMLAKQDKTFEVECQDCTALSQEGDSYDEAARQWNNRIGKTLPIHGEMREALRSEIEEITHKLRHGPMEHMLQARAANLIGHLWRLLSLTKTATNADMRGALSNFLKWADRVQTGSAGVDYLNGDDGTGQDGWEDLDALRELARTVLQGDKS